MKKLVCILLCLVMVLGVLAGCAKTETKTNEPKKEETKKEETKKEETKKEETKKEEAPADFDVDKYLPFGEGKTLRIGMQQIAKVEDWDNNELTKWIEEKTGVNIEWVFLSTNATEAQQQLSLMAASNEELPDVVWSVIGWKDAVWENSFADDGFLVSMSEYLNDPSVTPFWNQAIARVDDNVRTQIYNKITNPTDGNIYSLPYVSNMYVWDNRQSMMAINQTWLDKLGLKAPTTVDELHDVLKAFVEKDPNGNGKADEIGMLGQAKDDADILQYIINAYVYFDNNYAINVDDKGQLWVPYNTDEYREALKTITAWYNEGLLSSNCFVTVDSAELKPVISPADGISTVGIFCGHPSVITDEAVGNYMDYTPLAALKGENALGGYDVVRPIDIRPCSCITSSCKDVELAVRFLDFFLWDDAACSCRHGIRGVDWEYADVDAPRSQNNIVILSDGQAFFDGIRTYNRNAATILDCYNYLGVAEGKEGVGLKIAEDEVIMENMMRASEKKNIVADIVFTADEIESVTEPKANLKSYVRQARAEFCTGAKDINSDADWQEYLNTLESIGLTDYLALCQSAYTRMVG